MLVGYLDKRAKKRDGVLLTESVISESIIPEV